jgi:hypothetical protein
LLTSDSAQNKGAVDPKVQATIANVKGKGFLLEEGDLKPHQSVTFQMLINKFQHRQEKANGREEWARRNEGHWRCPFFKYCWEEGIKLPTTENCLECNRAYNNSSSSKRVCFDNRRPAARDHCEFNNQRVSVHDRLGARIASTIDWGASLVFTIGWEAESMKSQIISSKRWPILWSLMKISCAELLNWTMKGQAKHVRSPIHSGVQMS